MLVVSLDELTKEDIQRYLFSAAPDEFVLRFTVDLKHSLFILGSKEEIHLLTALEQLGNEQDFSDEAEETAPLLADHFIGCSAFTNTVQSGAFVLISKSSVEDLMAKFKIYHSGQSLQAVDAIVKKLSR